MKPEQWIVGDDTGVSSQTIWSVMMGVRPRWSGTPLDVDDFGRCVRLVVLIPAFRPRLQEVADKYPQWQPLIDHWEELERLYWACEAADRKGDDTYKAFAAVMDPLLREPK